MKVTNLATNAERKAANLRTALAFASIAVVFFFGIIVAHAFGGPLIGVGVMGVVVLLFLGFAIGRNLRASEDGGQGVSAGAPGDRGGRPVDSIDALPSTQRPHR